MSDLVQQLQRVLGGSWESRLATLNVDDLCLRPWKDLYMWPSASYAAEPTVWTALSALGVVSATVEFSGGNDEGGADRVMVQFTGGQQPDLLSALDGGEPLADQTALRALIRKLEEPVYYRYGGFAGEFYVSGSIRWSVPDRTVEYTGECYEDYGAE
jgi:hypothetical protein